MITIRVHKIIDCTVGDEIVRQWLGVEFVGGDGWLRLLPRDGALADLNIGDTAEILESDYR